MVDGDEYDPELVESARRSVASPDPDGRANAVSVLGAYGDCSDVGLVLPLLADHSAYDLSTGFAEKHTNIGLVRYRALEALLSLAERCPEPLDFAPYFRDDDPLFRQRAALGLQLEQARAALTTEKEPIVRLRLAMRIHELGDEIRARGIYAELKDHDGDIGGVAQTFLAAPPKA